MSVLTEIVSLGKENMSTIANKLLCKALREDLQEILCATFLRKGCRKNIMGLLQEV